MAVVALAGLTVQLPLAGTASAAGGGQGSGGGPTHGTTYYVNALSGSDANSGTSPARAWKTLADINDTQFKPGDRILLHAGDMWVGQILPQGSGASDAPITLSRYGQGAEPLVDGNGTTANDGAVVRLWNQQYWDISGLDLTNDATTGNFRNGILVVDDGGGTINHIHVQHCYIHDIDAVTTESVYNNAVGADNTPSSNLVKASYANNGAIAFRVLYDGTGATPSRFNDILVANNTIARIHNRGVGVGLSSDFSFYGYGSLRVPSTNITITNNTFSNGSWADVNVQTVDGQVGNGVVVSNNVSSGGIGYGASAADYWTFDGNDVVFRDNDIYGLHDTLGAGDSEAFDLDGFTYGSTIEYNYTHDNAGSFAMIYPDGNSADSGNVIRYNISQNDDMSLQTNWRTLRLALNATDNQIYNNDFFSSNGPIQKTLVYVDPASDYNRISNNIFFVAPNQHYDVGGKLSEFLDNIYYGSQPTPEPTDPKGSTADPDLVAAGTATNGWASAAAAYTPKPASPVIGKAVPISENGGADFNGTPLPSDPDIGATQSR